MKEYIERAAAINAIRQYQYPYGVEFLLANLPTADVAEVRHGRWVNPHWRNSDFACNCSACGVEAIHREYRWHERGIYPICPNCGARMYKEADHEVSEP